MSHIDDDHFAMALMIYLTKRSSINWRPTLIDLPFLSKEENGRLSKLMETIGRAVEKISSSEERLNAGQFKHLDFNLGSSIQDIPRVFVGSFSDGYLQSYSGDRFIGYMSYVTSFSIFCHRNGHVLAPDFAVITITETIRRMWNIFCLQRIWQDLFDVAETINLHEFDHSFFCNCDKKL